MCMKKQGKSKSRIHILHLLLCVFILSACASNSTQHIEASKSDTGYDEFRENSQVANNQETTRVQIITDFTNTDGSVQFNINIDEEIYDGAMPIIEVVPSTITSEDMERVAKSLFGDVEFYDGGPEENQFIPCNWTLKPDSYYNESGASGDEWLLANVKIDDMYGKFMVIVRDQGDYKLNRFNFQLGAVSLDTYLDRQIYWANLCRTAEPTQEQIEAVQNNVMDMLKKMDLGDWHIAETEVIVIETGGEPEYLLQIKIVPEFNGIPAIYGQRNITHSDNYTGAYTLTQATFLMSPNGDLIDLELDSPVEIKSVVNENVVTLSVERLAERIMHQLSLCDVDTFTTSTWGITFEQVTEEVTEREEALVVRVNISQMEYGLGRIMAKDTTDSYYYVPVMLLSGTVDVIGSESGEVYLSGYEKPLLCINAIDGSIIN